MKRSLTDPTPFAWSAATASGRLEDNLARIAAGEAGIAHVFTQIFAEEARRDAAALSQKPETALSGALVTIKDLVDVAGYATRGGSPALMDAPLAASDAPVVARLRAAGAVLVGHTNMTELAYSGIGINPHFGTPDNALYPGHVPGGSSSGGAISVARGLADIAIGSDTGGSIRIPAAFNGLVGFKPSQASVPRNGCIPLSVDLDSLGPIARSVAACEAVWRAIAEDARPAAPDARPVFVVPSNFGRDELDPEVEAGFAVAMSAIAKAGFDIVEQRLESLSLYKAIPVWQYSSVEARVYHDRLLAEHAAVMDRRVVQRMRRAESLSALDYRKVLNQRARFMDEFRTELGTRVLLLPTVAILPPPLAAMERDEDFTQFNLMALRNTTMGNVADACSISLPLSTGADTIGIMLTALGGRDPELLELAARLEPVLAKASGSNGPPGRTGA